METETPATSGMLEQIANGGAVIGTRDGARYWLMILVSALVADGICEQDICNQIMEKAYPKEGETDA